MQKADLFVDEGPKACRGQQGLARCVRAT